VVLREDAGFRLGRVELPVSKRVCTRQY
jgi:hypothetical protein